ncbi:hypothetical protein D1007_46763 [Hordeum vulgare]|nr:hypothetical protein D1007_46763 [Hordeum vulgare]
MEVEASAVVDGGSLVEGLAGPVLLLDRAVAVVVTRSFPGSGTTAATTTHLPPMLPPDLMTPRAGMKLRWGSRRLRVGSGFPRARDPPDLRVRERIARSPPLCVVIKGPKRIRAVAQICYVGRIVLKTSGAVVNVTKWSSAVGSKGVMEVAWVRVSNVPVDKRSERNMAYVASLVGVPLEIDSATLHRPASARVKVGCRNVDEIPSVAEAVLGKHFYDFYFEVDQILVRDPNRGESLLSSGKNMDKEKNDDVDTNKNKKPRIDASPTGAVEEKMRMSRLGEKRTNPGISREHRI